MPYTTPLRLPVVLCFCLFIACGSERASGQRVRSPQTAASNSKNRSSKAATTVQKPQNIRSSADQYQDISSSESADSGTNLDADESDSTTASSSDAQVVEELPLGGAIPIETKDDKALSSFHAALDRVQQQGQKARITFYGASHVASDLFTGRIRQKLQKRFGDSGPGFVMPAKPWKWHRHSAIRYKKTRGWNTYRVEARDPKEGKYGYAGVTLASKPILYALARIETRKNGGVANRSNLFELYYLKHPRGGRMFVFIDGKRIRKISTYSKEVETAYEIIKVDEGHHSFEIRTLADGPVRIFGVAIENENPGVVLDTVGIPGSRARYHLLWDDVIYREHLKRRRPDLVVLAYGTNESVDDDVPIELYESRLRDVVRRIRETVPEASCLLIGPSDYPVRNEDESVSERPRTAQLIQVQRRVSFDFSCGFFDLVRFMGGPMSMMRWVSAHPPLAAPDHLHFNRRGYERLGDVLYEALLAGYTDPESESP